MNEEYIENQTKLNLSEIYNNEEIKLLKKSIPGLSNMIYLATNNEINNIDTSKYVHDRTNQKKCQYLYVSPLRKIRNNLNTSYLIDKEKFYIFILNEIKLFFEKEQNLLLSKSISLIMNEILNISKILKQNLIYIKFFKSIKNTKLINYSSNENRQSKIAKLKNSSVISKNNSKNKNIIKRNIYSHENLKINDNSRVKEHLSFKTEGEIKKDNKKEFSKSVYEINSLSKEKNKTYSTNFFSKRNKTNNNSIFINNKTNNNINKKNISKRSINSMNNSSSRIKNIKKPNNNFLIGPTKISLTKKNYDNKKLGFYEFMNSKTEHNLTGNNINSKKLLKDRENKSSQKNNMKIVISPSTINRDFYKNIETQEFNIFNLEKKIGREIILPLIGYYVFNTFELGEVIKYNKFEKWCQKISDGYIRNNFYHNDLHAADITQTCLLYIKLGELQKLYNFQKYELCTVFLSCLCHDYQHPGVNNNFLKETNNKLSIRYNDISILENMHISSTFKLILRNKDYNIFENVEKDIYKKMRKGMISCVLATDMAFHNVYVDILKNLIKNKNETKEENINDKNKEEYQNYLNILIHSSDISNPTKLFDIYFKWAKLVVEEFWAQGDKEKKLNLSCSCDREKVTIYQSQLGFINFIEIPYFSLFAEKYPKLKFYYENLINNKSILLSMQEKEKEKKEKEKLKEKSKNL